jgi:hypothetical protein
MSSPQLLPLSVAIDRLKTNKVDLRVRANLSIALFKEIEERGATLAEADRIALAFGVHPSEIWGDNWVDAVLTFQEDGNE